MSDQKPKVFCRDCSHLKTEMFAIYCDVTQPTWFGPDEFSMPGAKNANNDCPDFEKRKATLGPMDN